MLHTLQADIRTEKGRKTNALRATSRIPAVVYGAGTDSKAISVDRNSFIKTYNEAGESSIVELKIDGTDALHVLIQDYQQDPLTDEVTHIDFRSVDMNKPIDAVVELNFIGESAAVKALGGTLIKSRDSVSINTLPNKLMRHIDVDLSALATFEDAIRISDLKVEEGVTITDDAGLTIAVVSKPRTAAEMAKLDEAVEEDVSTVEGATEEAKEGEEGASKEG